MYRTIVLDAALREKLGAGTDQIEVQDEDGKFVGMFLPVGLYKYFLRNLKLPFSDEELALPARKRRLHPRRDLETIGGEMIYTVAWTQPAMVRLASLWLQAPDRAAVTLAADHIDALLRVDPYTPHSVSRDDNTRVLVVEPLGVSYTVSDLDRMVTVEAVWQT